METPLLIQCITTGNQSNARKQRKFFSTHWQSELKKKPSWATVGPAKDKHQALTNRWKRHGVWSLTHSEFHAFLKWRLFSTTNEIKIASLTHKLEPIRIPYFVCFDFDPFKLNKLYFAKYQRYCSEIFTNYVNNIELLLNNRILKLFNIIKLL